MIAECNQEGEQEGESRFNTSFVSANKLFLDFAGDEIHESPTWVSTLGQPGAVVSIEIFGAIDVEIKGEFLFFKAGQI